MDDKPATSLQANPENHTVETIALEDIYPSYGKQWIAQARKDFFQKLTEEKTLSGIAGFASLVLSIALFLFLESQPLLSLLPVGIFGVILAVYFDYVLLRAPKKIDEQKRMDSQVKIASLTARLEAATRELHAKNTRPEIACEIVEVHLNWSLGPDGAKDEPELEAFFTIKARVVGRNTIPSTLRFEAWADSPRAKCKLLRSSLKNILIRRTQHSTGFGVFVSKMESIDEEACDLEALCQTPLTMGGEREGWLRFVLRKAGNPIRKEIDSITLVVKDAYGQEHSFVSERSEWHSDGELITKDVAEWEQQRIKDLDSNHL